MLIKRHWVLRTTHLCIKFELSKTSRPLSNSYLNSCQCSTSLCLWFLREPFLSHSRSETKEQRHSIFKTALMIDQLKKNTSSCFHQKAASLPLPARSSQTICLMYFQRWSKRQLLTLQKPICGWTKLRKELYTNSNNYLINKVATSRTFWSQRGLILISSCNDTCREHCSTTMKIR